MSRPLEAGRYRLRDGTVCEVRSGRRGLYAVRFDGYQDERAVWTFVPGLIRRVRDELASGRAARRRVVEGHVLWD